ncbi:MAG: hypothetical protein WA085_04050 [Sphingobium sp.]|uniref:hypothetical protein n=1 Tax=Sphingobium sp. CECT 9361 TaxID=2845384 RepID=UPI001E4DC162|nr:hypothetical protein [Sphingobium sp. CECT 9361]CAH0348342.1 hypothetical protein SPH9361_00052 [Sphingobium sp. CECT 9361]
MIINEKTAFQDQGTLDDDLLCGVGQLVCAWGLLEQRLEQKIGILREAAGDVRTIGSRTRPGMAKLLAELRAMVSMRDRRNATVLGEIAALERDIQRIDRFRGLIVSGFQGPEPRGFACRDHRNAHVHVSFDQLGAEIAQLGRIGERLLTL